MEIVEGKDQPVHLPEEYSELGSTVGLMLRYVKSLHGNRKVLELDCSFYVLKRRGGVEEKRSNSAILIQKIRFWTTHLPGEEIKKILIDWNVGMEVFIESSFICIV